MNKRIWIWINQGWVRITIAPDRATEFWTGGRHEEGYSYTYYRYYQEGDEVVYEANEDARDCDGRLDRYWSGVMCGQREFDAATDHTLRCEKGEMLLIPNWEKRSSSQRDYNAESMGY